MLLIVDTNHKYWECPDTTQTINWAVKRHQPANRLLFVDLIFIFLLVRVLVNKH